MLNPNFGRGTIGQSSPVNTVNLGRPQTHTGLGQQQTNRNEAAIPMSNLFYAPPNANDNSTGRTLRQDQTTRPLIIPYIANISVPQSHSRSYNASVGGTYPGTQ